MWQPVTPMINTWEITSLFFFPSPSFIFPKKYVLVTHRSRVKGEIVIEIGDCLRVSVTVTRHHDHGDSYK